MHLTRVDKIALLVLSQGNRAMPSIPLKLTRILCLKHYSMNLL